MCALDEPEYPTFSSQTSRTRSNCLTNPMNAQDYTAKRRPVINKKTANYITLAIFAPILILAGVAGFLVPDQHSLTSGAPAYNVFHLCFGTIGLIILSTRNQSLISFFNTGFGLIDLYQALASYLHLPPEKYFLWTRVDDVLHILIGLALVVIGGYSLLKRERRSS